MERATKAPYFGFGVFAMQNSEELVATRVVQRTDVEKMARGLTPAQQWAISDLSEDINTVHAIGEMTLNEIADVLERLVRLLRGKI